MTLISNSDTNLLSLVNLALRTGETREELRLLVDRIESEEARVVALKAIEDHPRVEYNGRRYLKGVADRVQHWPKNRLGHPVEYAWWLCSGRVPEGVETTCSVCGEVVIDAAEVFPAEVFNFPSETRSVMAEVDLKTFSDGLTGLFFDDVPTKICRLCALHSIEGDDAD